MSIMDILIFKINNFDFGIETDKILKVEKIYSTIEIKNFLYVDLYKNFFGISKDYTGDYFIFLKNKIYFNTESIESISEQITVREIEPGKYFLKTYQKIVKSLFIHKSNIGIILNEKILKEMVV